MDACGTLMSPSPAYTLITVNKFITVHMVKCQQCQNMQTNARNSTICHDSFWNVETLFFRGFQNGITIQESYFNVVQFAKLSADIGTSADEGEDLSASVCLGHLAFDTALHTFAPCCGTSTCSPPALSCTCTTLAHICSFLYFFCMAHWADVLTWCVFFFKCSDIFVGAVTDNTPSQGVCGPADLHFSPSFPSTETDKQLLAQEASLTQPLT